MSPKLPILAPNDSQFGIHSLRDCTIEGHRVEIGTGSVADSLINCRFIDCEIRIKCSGHRTGSVLYLNHFERCLIWPGVIQKIPSLQADFHSCHFKGRYEVGFHDTVEDCCFSEAKLNHALFFTPTPLEPCKLPGWPHIWVDDLAKNGPDFMAAVPKLSLLWIMARKRPLSMVVNLQEASKSLDETWDVLRDKSYISTKREEA